MTILSDIPYPPVIDTSGGDIAGDLFNSVLKRTNHSEINAISRVIVDAAMKVHSALGPGLLESAYEACLKHELSKRGLTVASQVLLPVQYDGVAIDAGYRIDLLVEDAVVVELKAVEKVVSIHEAQLLTYLKLSGKKLGLLLNFNVLHMKDGIKVRNWEQGVRHPEGPARILLQVIDREPEAVMRALRGEFGSQSGMQVAEGEVAYAGKRSRCQKQK